MLQYIETGILENKLQLLLCVLLYNGVQVIFAKREVTCHRNINRFTETLQFIIL